MLKVLQDQTCSSQMRTFDNIQKFNHIGVVELFQDMILSLNLWWFDWYEHLDNNFFLCFYVSALEDVRIPAAAKLVRDCIVFQLAI